MLLKTKWKQSDGAARPVTNLIVLELVRRNCFWRLNMNMQRLFSKMLIVAKNRLSQKIYCLHHKTTISGGNIYIQQLLKG
jgi:ribosomal protein S4E